MSHKENISNKTHKCNCLRIIIIYIDCKHVREEFVLNQQQIIPDETKTNIYANARRGKKWLLKLKKKKIIMSTFNYYFIMFDPNEYD